MRIGIITYHWVPNFGANLQSLATISMLRKFGHEPYIINYRPKSLVEKYEKTVSREQLLEHEKFLEEYLPQTELCQNLEEVSLINKKYNFETLISGSDAVLRLNYKTERDDLMFPNPFWLTFANNNQNKIFFSVSNMGTSFSKLDKNIKAEITKTLKNSKIFVRDKWTEKQIKLLDKEIKIEQLSDPMFLIEKYFKIPEKYNREKKEKYIILNLYKHLKNKKWVEQLNKIIELNNYKLISLPNPEDNSIKKVENNVNLPLHPLEWYSLIKNSSGYIGVRFHPIVASILNNVPFVSFDTYNDKIISLDNLKSKTYDLCKKTKKTKFCKNKLKQKIISPRKTFQLLTKNHDNNHNYIEKEIDKIETIFKNL
ncbi:MAG: polysaccharide pyruvyl transferase family protein [Patescibacteria group bacterium]|jgi:polysaccharide pyruvyl transferase WcaK-like protein